VHGSRRFCIFLSAFALFALQASSLLADGSPSISQFAAKGFPDNVDIRSRLFSYLIGAPQNVALAYGEKQAQSSSAGPVTVKVEKRTSDFLVEFINQNSSVPDTPGRGSCYIQRSSGKGNYILQARILLQDDPSCFLALYPSGSGTRGDVIMYGAVVKRGLYISDLLYRILLLSFSDIVDATNRSFDWSQVFRFDAGGAVAAGEMRSSVAQARGADEGNSAGQGAAGGLSGHVSGKVALAAAPALPSTAVDALPKGSRSLKIAAASDRAMSVESLILDLGDMDARELSPGSDALGGYLESSENISKLSYSEFPRYDKGISLASVKAVLYSDLLANPGASYVLLGDGFHATVQPYFDEAGRLNFACFSGGKEVPWSDLNGGKRDIKVRAVRVPAGT